MAKNPAELVEEDDGDKTPEAVKVMRRPHPSLRLLAIAGGAVIAVGLGILLLSKRFAANGTTDTGSDTSSDNGGGLFFSTTTNNYQAPPQPGTPSPTDTTGLGAVPPIGPPKPPVIAPGPGGVNPPSPIPTGGPAGPPTPGPAKPPTPKPPVPTPGGTPRPPKTPHPTTRKRTPVHKVPSKPAAPAKPTVIRHGGFTLKSLVPKSAGGGSGSRLY